MKKFNYLIMGLFVALFLTGCSSNLKEGNYYSISDEWGKVKLSVSEDDKVTIDYLSVNDAIDEAIDSSFVNKLFSNSLNESKITLKGTIDKKKKEFHFTEPKEMTAQYTLKSGTIVMSDKDDKEFSQTFYAENDKKLDSLTEDFEKNTDGTPEYVQNLIGQADYDVNDSENSYDEESEEDKDVYSQQSKEKTKSFKSEEITKTAVKIKEDFLKSMIGAWVGGDYDIQGVDSSLMINEDKTFTATYTSVSGDSNINYTGKFDFSESNTLEDKITELLEKETISSLNEIDTYSKYSLIVGKYDNSIDLKFAVSFTGTDFGKDVSKSDIIKIVGLSLDDGKLDFNNVLYDTIKGISVKYYIK